VKRFPYLDSPTAIQLEKGRTVGITFNLFRETMQFKKDATCTEDDGPMSKRRIASLLHSGDGYEDIDADDPPKLVTDLKARTAAMLKAAGLGGMADPKLMISDTCKSQSLVVVDMSPEAVKKNKQDWEQRYKGRRYHIDSDGDITLHKEYTHSLTIKEYPLKFAYADTEGQVNTPLAFLYPSIKAFMDVCLADPYFFHDRGAVTMAVQDLVGIEARSTYNRKSGEIYLKDFEAEYARAKEALKKL
jgi:hypothetical protein